MGLSISFLRRGQSHDATKRKANRTRAIGGAKGASCLGSEVEPENESAAHAAG
jgi:hypothetical protein